MCICRGPDLTAELAAKRPSQVFCKLCPKGSRLKALVRAGYIVFNMFSTWYHVGFYKLNPRKPTFLQTSRRAEMVWDHIVLDPVYEGEYAKTLTVHKALLDCDLTQPASLHVYRLVAFDRPLQNWKPDALLTVAPLHETLEIAKELQF